MTALPDDQGWVELLNENEHAVGKARTGSVVAYFFKSDRQTPLDPPPTDVTLKLSGAEKGAVTLPLAPAPAAGDPAGAARFASKAGPDTLSDTPGELSGKLAGKAFTLKFRARR